MKVVFLSEINDFDLTMLTFRPSSSLQTFDGSSRQAISLFKNWFLDCWDAYWDDGRVGGCVRVEVMILAVTEVTVDDEDEAATVTAAPPTAAPILVLTPNISNFLKRSAILNMKLLQ